MAWTSQKLISANEDLIISPLQKLFPFRQNFELKVKAMTAPRKVPVSTGWSKRKSDKKMHPSSKAAFEFAALDERCIKMKYDRISSEVHKAKVNLVKRGQISDQAANLDSAVFILVYLCDKKWGVVNIKQATVRNFGLLAYYRSATILFYIVLQLLYRVSLWLNEA